MRDVMKARIKVSAAKRESEEWRREMFFRRKKAEVLVKGEVAVEDNSKVAAVGGRGQGGVIDGELAVGSGLTYQSLV